MRILHLTDLHINPDYNRINIDKTESIIARALDYNIDHLAITGDISHDGDKESFFIFREILKKYNLLDPLKATITIGNHDIFGGVHTVKDLLNFPERSKNTDFNGKVSEFIRYFEELFVDTYFPVKDLLFPNVKVIGDFALISINTNDVYSPLKNPFSSNGKVSVAEQEGLKNIFTLPEFKDKTKIILSHHHYYKNSFESKSSSNEIWNKIEGYTLKLRGKKKLLKLFKNNNVPLILHGHSHENKKYQRMGIAIINSAGSIDNENPNLAVTNIVDLCSNQITLESEEIILQQFANIEFAAENVY